MPASGAFPDIRFTIDDVVSERNMVAARWTAKMTHRGDHLGVPGTQKPLTITGMVFLRIEGNKIVEGLEPAHDDALAWAIRRVNRSGNPWGVVAVPTISDLDICRAANLLIRQHGSEAELEAQNALISCSNVATSTGKSFGDGSDGRSSSCRLRQRDRRIDERAIRRVGDNARQIPPFIELICKQKPPRRSREGRPRIRFVWTCVSNVAP